MLYKKQYLTQEFYARISNWQQRANTLGLMSDNFIDVDIINLLEYWDNCCVYCGTSLEDGFEIDHAVPLSAKFADEYPHLNTIQNLLCACKRCNGRKSDKHYEDFADEETIEKIDYYFATVA